MLSFYTKTEVLRFTEVNRRLIVCKRSVLKIIQQGNHLFLTRVKGEDNTKFCLPNAESRALLFIRCVGAAYKAFDDKF